jgi:hypothetical protein
MVTGDWWLVTGEQGRAAHRAGQSEFTDHQPPTTSH